MGRIKEVLGKVKSFVDNQNHTGHPKISPAEMELKSYLERERQDNIKQALDHYRKKNSDELWRGKPMESSAPLFNTPQFGQKKSLVRPKKVPSLLGGGFL